MRLAARLGLRSNRVYDFRKSLPGGRPSRGMNEISQFPKGVKPRLASLREGGGILERPVKALGITGKHRAFFACFVADGDHEIELVPCELRNRLRSLGRNIDTDVSHHRNRFRADRRWMCAGGENVVLTSSFMP